MKNNTLKSQLRPICRCISLYRNKTLLTKPSLNIIYDNNSKDRISFYDDYERCIFRSAYYDRKYTLRISAYFKHKKYCENNKTRISDYYNNDSKFKL